MVVKREQKCYFVMKAGDFLVIYFDIFIQKMKQKLSYIKRYLSCDIMILLL